MLTFDEIARRLENGEKVSEQVVLNNITFTQHYAVNGIALVHDYASISGFVTNLTDFWDSSKQWNGRLELASPADSNLFPDISQTNTPANITRSDTAAYIGYAAGAMIVGETRKVLGGFTEIGVNFNSRRFDLEVGMFAYDKAEGDAIFEIAEFVETNGADNVTNEMVDTVEDFLSDVVEIRANDVGFSPNGELVGTPKFEVTALTQGTAEPLIEVEGDLKGGFYGPSGQISALSGEATQGQNTIIWGAISAER